MKQTIIAALLLIAPAECARAQDCYGGICYPRQPATPARLVMPIESAMQTAHDAHCRIHVGDGTTGSGTLISTNDTTGLDDTSSGVVVSFPHGGRFGARLIDRDPANDLAALLIQRPNVEPVAVDDSEPTGVLTACGYGGNGQFRPATGPVSGAVQSVGATFPSLKIGGAVRPGDSGGGVLDRAGRLVGVVWGCRDGETYLTCGRPLRQFLDRVWQGRQRAGSSSTPDLHGREDGSARHPTIDWQAWRDEIDSRLAALDARKQDRGEYLQLGDLHSYAQKSDVGALKTAVFDRIQKQIEERVRATGPGLFAGMSYGKLAAGALGLSGPLALAVIVAGGLAGRRVKRKVSGVRDQASGVGPTPDTRHLTPSSPDTYHPTPFPVAIDSPPPPQVTATERHYVPYENDNFRRAHDWAAEQIVRKYPGATDYVAAMDSLIQQQLAGNRRN
jgi:hypothetical protein